MIQVPGPSRGATGTREIVSWNCPVFNIRRSWRVSLPKSDGGGPPRTPPSIAQYMTSLAFRLWPGWPESS